MFKNFIIILFVSFIFCGCMPSEIKTNHQNNIVKQNMINRSLINIGNTYRINKKYQSIKNGNNYTIAFIGSSAFIEDEQGNSVANIAYDKIKNLFGKKAKFDLINFSVNGTNSEFGNIMLNQEVLSKLPDLILVDYAVFDGHEQDDRENFEALIRSCLEQENEPQVVIFINSKSDSNQKQDFMEQIARYYNLPVINTSTAFLPEISAGRMNSNEIFYDNQISDSGKEYIADFCVNYFKNAVKNNKDKSYITPPSMYTNLLVINPKLITARNLNSENDGSYIRTNINNKIFKNSIQYLSNTKNLPFIFILEANNIYLIAPVSKDRHDVFEILINGKKTKEFSNYSELSEKDIPKVFKVYSSNKVEKVAIAIQLKENENETNIDNISNFEFWGVAYTKNELKNY